MTGRQGEPGRNRVLVVDDNPDLRDFLRSLLADHYDVDLAADGMAALARISRRLPDIVVSDVMMPKMNGYALCDAIRRTPRSCTSGDPAHGQNGRRGEARRLRVRSRRLRGQAVDPQELVSEIRSSFPGKT